jgi:ABC-type lipoprotein release transport system permease subunit
MFLMGRLKATAPQVVTTLLVFSLASGVLGGILFYFDSTRPAVMSEMMSGVDYDMRLTFTPGFYSQGGVAYETLLSEIRAVNGVEYAEHLSQVDTFRNRYWSGVTDSYSMLGVDASFLHSFGSLFEISQNALPLNGNRCYIEQASMVRLGLSINDTLSAEMLVQSSGFFYQVSDNLTIAGWFQTSYSWPIVASPFGDSHDDTPPVKLLVQQAQLRRSFGFLGNITTSSLREAIWVKLSNTVLYQSSPEAAQSSLAGIRTSIEQRTVPYAIVSDYPAMNSVLGYAAWSSSISAIAIAFSIPSIVMGMMLVKYNDDLLEDERRQEIGNIRVRGATGWQSFDWILSRALVTGILGSVAAIGTGVLAAFFSGSVRELFVIDFRDFASFSVLVTPEAAAFVFCFSFVIGLVVSLPAAVKSLLMPPVEAHSKMRDESVLQIEEMANPTTDLLAVVVSGVLSVVFLPLLASESANASSVPLTVLTVIVFGAFSFSAVRFLSRFTGILKEKVMSRVRGGSNLPGFRLMARTARFHSKSEAIGVLFISMVFVSAFFSTIAATTSSDHLRNLVLFDYGAQIVVEANPNVEESNLASVNKIRNITGVADAAGILEVPLNVVYQIAGPYSTETYTKRFTIVGVESPQWASASFFLPYFTKTESAAEDLKQMATNTSLVLSSFLPILGFDVKPDYSYEPVYGDKVMLLSGTQGVNQTLRIIDILSVDGERDSETFLPGYPGATGFLVVNIKLLFSILGTNRISRVVVKTEPGSDHKEIMASVRSSLGPSFISIKSAFDEVDAILSTRASQSIYGIYSLNLLFSVFYLTVGMTIVTYEKNKRMSKQYSILRALGTDPGTVGFAVMIDVLIAVGFSCIAGAAVATVMVIMVIHTPLVYLSASLPLDWDVLPISIAVPWLGLAAVLAIAFLFSIISTLALTRRMLRVSIAEDIGHAE